MSKLQLWKTQQENLQGASWPLGPKLIDGSPSNRRWWWWWRWPFLRPCFHFLVPPFAPRLHRNWHTALHCTLHNTQSTKYTPECKLYTLYLSCIEPHHIQCICLVFALYWVTFHNVHQIAELHCTTLHWEPTSVLQNWGWCVTVHLNLPKSWGWN